MVGFTKGSKVRYAIDKNFSGEERLRAREEAQKLIFKEHLTAHMIIEIIKRRV